MVNISEFMIRRRYKQFKFEIELICFL